MASAGAALLEAFGTGRKHCWRLRMYVLSSPTGLCCPLVALAVGQTALADAGPHWAGHEACGAILKRKRLVRRQQRRGPLPQPTPEGILKPLTNILGGHTPPRIRGVHSRYQKKAEGQQEDLEHREREVMGSGSYTPSLPRKRSFVHPPHQNTSAATAGFVCYLSHQGLKFPQLI